LPLKILANLPEKRQSGKFDAKNWVMVDAIKSSSVNFRHK